MYFEMSYKIGDIGDTLFVFHNICFYVLKVVKYNPTIITLCFLGFLKFQPAALQDL